ncbi:MAG TPA: TetR/AcrR family transcriptional regulator [Edaphobacter sp.]|nr:TetR/AcrR family transcriptional regulator [Edaphobacter sp.]
MTVKTANKHELRTRETRALLLAAAETIFVRDGYEGAELGEIATLAGRTKGAIYAQFKSKEEIFLALVEHHTLRYRAQMEELLTKSTSIEGNLAALRQFMLNLAKDEAWALLFLEFKLFIIRHPESKKRLQSFYARLLPGNKEVRYAEFLGPAGKGKKSISRTIAVHTLQPLLSALLLEAKVDSEMWGEDSIRKVVGRVFDALLEVPSP